MAVASSTQARYHSTNNNNGRIHECGFSRSAPGRRIKNNPSSADGGGPPIVPANPIGPTTNRASQRRPAGS